MIAPVKSTEPVKNSEWTRKDCEERHKTIRSVMVLSVSAVSVIGLAVGWQYQTISMAAAQAQSTAIQAAEIKASAVSSRENVDQAFSSLYGRIGSMETRQTEAIRIVDERQQKVLEKLNTISGELKARGVIGSYDRGDGSDSGEP